ncbi:MAG TPA: CDP-diacylglycerol--serine O-phosphatidyltransferase [Ignavibacteria bacterium]|nr:CDP-diacylglycerol--serine O-phosphatidyltransferase [Bacteroidota bacterium]HRI84377.1 CDP-diacylglycerol--serine O-phosphatidyltransferase [Ignavibacteria bacterium]HRJ99348.1 CDP-diacylglycerol--serine O-phosphatidyltransferase [Ignavibacteria bacterium]
MLISRKFIPSLFTILNAFCGMMSVINSAKGDFESAALFIIYASLFDAVDGLAARLTNSSSKFGVELDSLSDVISFGLAPSILIYYVFLNVLGDVGIVLSSLIMVFAAIRLARFNVQLTGFDKVKFNGLPAPMSAFTVCTYILFYHNKIFPENVSEIFLISLSMFLPVMMVSKVKYDTIPKPSLHTIKKNPIVYIIILIAVILIIATKGEGSFSFCLFYIFSGIIRSGYNMIFRRHKKNEDNFEESPALNKSK